jgi:hypothetical protein
VWQDIINISCCIIWWFPSEIFFLIFQLPNGQFLILDFSKVWNQLNMWILIIKLVTNDVPTWAYVIIVHFNHQKINHK